MGGKLIVLVFVLLAAGLAWWAFRSPSAPAGKPALTIVVASTLAPAMQPLTDEFRKRHPDVEVTWQPGSSSQLYTQIVKGMRTDVFVSADVKFIDMLDKESVIEKASRRVIARAGLCVLIRKGLADDAKGEQAVLAAITSDAINPVAIPNPTTAPVGAAAKTYLESKGVWAKIQSKMVQADSAERTAALFISGNAAAGILSGPLAFKPDVTAKFNLHDIPSASVPPVSFTLVIIPQKDAAAGARKPAHEFAEFLKSSEAGAILKSVGFLSGD